MIINQSGTVANKKIFFFIREHTVSYETSDLVFGPVYLKQKHSEFYHIFTKLN